MEWIVPVPDVRMDVVWMCRDVDRADVTFVRLHCTQHDLYGDAIDAIDVIAMICSGVMLHHSIYRDEKDRLCSQYAMLCVS